MKIALTGDWHIGSKNHLGKKLQEYLKIAYDSGVREVYVCGDMLDGHDVYFGQLNDQLAWEEDGQVELASEAIDKWAKKLQFRGVYGNHDYSFVKLAGTDPLKAISKNCGNFKPIESFGKYSMIARKHIGGKDLEIVHGRSNAKTHGYVLETYLRERDKTQALDVPDVLGMGHTHRFDSLDSYGCHAFLAGNFMAPNEYTLRRGMISPAGGWIIDFDDELCVDKVNARKILP